MRIIISPAKKMNIDADSLDIKALPVFLGKAEHLRAAMRRMTKSELQTLWNCNAAIAEKSFRQLWQMDLNRNLTPAILAYEGIQYKTMAPGVFTGDQFDYIDAHLRVLSGFYGLLRPFDGVVPYRLEMQARLSLGGYRDLYAYWGPHPARQLFDESDFILNLASKEYSQVISPHLPVGIRFITCTFGELNQGTIVQKGTLCKIARGQMVRWLAENKITRPKDLRHFNELGYTFRPEHSTQSNMVFVKAADPLKVSAQTSQAL